MFKRAKSFARAAAKPVIKIGVMGLIGFEALKLAKKVHDLLHEGFLDK
jgi:hypothetical protein